MIRTITTICFACFIVSGILAQSKEQLILGAWQRDYKDDKGAYKGIGIVTDGYFSVAKFDQSGKRFISTIGGSWYVKGDTIYEKIEFNTENPDLVGTTVSSYFSVDNKQLSFIDSKEEWKRVDTGQPGKLFGAWAITGRERNGQMFFRQPNARITMKILSGTRFQWIAYNTETTEFLGTGGGTYTTEDGKYVENIEFFSRNSARVGASLSFDFELKDDGWHHRGKSSSGKPIYEIWGLRSKL
ncbi:MAG: membrane or secreted protein [Bacteroidota bacterium]